MFFAIISLENMRYNTMWGKQRRNSIRNTAQGPFSVATYSGFACSGSVWPVFCLFHTL